MMKRPNQKRTAWILIAIFGISGAVSSGGRVLCIGADGHSQIEQAVEACCIPGVVSDFDRAFNDVNQEDSECGDCNDIEVSNLLSFNRSVIRSDWESPQLFASINYLDSRALISILAFDKRDILKTLSPTVSYLVVTTTVLIL